MRPILLLSDTSTVISWNSTGKIGHIGRHLAEKPDVKVTMCFGPMPPDASDFPSGIPAIHDSKSTSTAHESFRVTGGKTVTLFIMIILLI